LPESIDWPVKTKTPRPRRRTFLFILGALAVIVFFSRTALSYWVDLLWFRSLGYGDVFWKTRGLEWGIFTAFAVVTFLVLFGAFSALKHAHIDDLPRSHTIVIAGNPVNLPVESALRLIAVGVSLLISLATAAAMEAQWNVLALYWYAPRTTGSVSDPIFGLPLNFYLFTLPASAGCSPWPFSVAFLPFCSS